MTSTKRNRAIATYRTQGGFCGDRTLAAVVDGVPKELLDQLTSTQIGLVMSAVNQAYHRGRASTGAEMVDTDAVWVDAWRALVELPPAGKPDGIRFVVTPGPR